VPEVALENWLKAFPLLGCWSKTVKGLLERADEGCLAALADSRENSNGSPELVSWAPLVGWFTLRSGPSSREKGLDTLLLWLCCLPVVSLACP